MTISSNKILIALWLLATRVVSGQGVVPPEDAKCLMQADFAEGTLIISKSGSYKLCEDVSFKPSPIPGGAVSPLDAFRPDYTKYNKFNYGLGYFAAISIKAENVDIFLDGFTIEQSEEHALMQRFFAVIEVGGSPFVSGAGPAEFVGPNNQFMSGSNIRIIGPGTIGRSSHHGIHGNDCQNVHVQGVTFTDFEVAAVSLNNVDGLVIDGCTIPRNRRNIPVNGMFSAAVFISHYGKWLKNKHPRRKITFADGETLTSEQLYENLSRAVTAVYDSVINKDGTAVDPLFANPLKFVDGPCYAFLVHGKGPAINDHGHLFGPKERTSSNVVIKNNKINAIKCWNKEIPAAVINGKVQNDARGAVFQFVDTLTGKNLTITWDNKYKRNPVADMQIFVAKAIHDGILSPEHKVLQTAANTMDPELVEWATTPGATLEPVYRCNGDSMHHVVKGITVIRVDDTKGFKIKNNAIKLVENVSVKPFSTCTDVHAAAEQANAGEQRMADIKGISIAACRGFKKGGGSSRKRSSNAWSKPSQIAGNRIEQFSSKHAKTIIGIDIQGQTRGVALSSNKVDLSSKSPAASKFMAVRVRGTAEQSSIIISNKASLDEGVVREDPVVSERRLAVPPGHEEFVLEWANNYPGTGSGCPFARGLRSA